MTQPSLFEQPAQDLTKGGIVGEKFDYTENREIRDNAIQQGIDHANEVEENWASKAYSLLVKFLYEIKTDFTSEDFRAYCTDKLPPPPDQRAFGGIMMKASKQGLIKPTGQYREGINKQCHMNPKKVWIKN